MHTPRTTAVALVCAALCSLACRRPEATVSSSPAASALGSSAGERAASPLPAQPEPVEPAAERRQIALLAGGCFWGMEELLRSLPGVLDTTVGYTGGSLEGPGYEDVKGGASGHAESVQVVFDPDRISYRRILQFFFSIHDPTTENRQGNDIGTQYRSAIFVLDEQQRRVAREVIDEVSASGDWKRPLTTEVASATAFYPAESYHQDYLQKHPGGYTCHYQRDTTYY